MAIIDEQRVAADGAARTGSQPPGAPRAHTRVVAIVLGAALLVAILVVAIILLSSSSSDKSGSYRQKVRAAMAPLVSANKTLSASLQALHGQNVKAAASAANRVEQTLLATRAAIGALPVPHSAASLARQTQRALAQENAYLQSVGATLANPSASIGSGVRGLASATSSAFAGLANVAPGGQASVSGTDGLLNWTQSRSGTHQVQTTIQPGKPSVVASPFGAVIVNRLRSTGAAVNKLRGTSAVANKLRGASVGQTVIKPPGLSASTAGNPTGADVVTPSGAPVPGWWSIYPAPYASGVGTPYSWSGGTNCDQNIFAGDNTACSFADNIFQVVAAAYHYYNYLIPNSVITQDPSTGTTYAVMCTEYWGTDNQTDLQCINGNGAGTAFPVWAAQAYYG